MLIKNMVLAYPETINLLLTMHLEIHFLNMKSFTLMKASLIMFKTCACTLLCVINVLTNCLITYLNSGELIYKEA